MVVDMMDMDLVRLRVHDFLHLMSSNVGHTTDNAWRQPARRMVMSPLTVRAVTKRLRSVSPGAAVGSSWECTRPLTEVQSEAALDIESKT